MKSWIQNRVVLIFLFAAGCCTAQAQQEGVATEAEPPSDATFALKAVADFAAAETWEDAAKLVLDAEALRPKMEAHYKRFKWRPGGLESIRYDRSHEVKGLELYATHDFELRFKDGKTPVLCTVVQSGEEYLVDWEIFAQLRDQSFETFLEEKSKEPVSFRVSCVRGVPFAKENELKLPGGVERLRIRWRPGAGDAVVGVLTGKSSEMGLQVAKLVSWANYRPMRIEVRWTESGGNEYVELVGLEAIDFSTPSVVGSGGS